MKSIILFLKTRIYLYTIISCLIVIGSGYVYVYCRDTYFQSLSLILFFTSGLFVLYAIVRFAMGLRRADDKGGGDEISKDDKYQFDLLANTMGIKLDNKRPYRLIKRFHSIGVVPIRLKPYVILGEDLYNKLTPEEKISILAHEFAHLKMCHIGVIAFLAILALTVVRYTAIAVAHDLVELIVSISVTITAILLSFWAGSHYCEYWADCVAIKYCKNREAFVSGLKKIKPKDKWGAESITHPSINARIARIDKKYP